MTYCQWISLISTDEVERWGAAVCDLAEVARSGATVAPGFVLSAEVYGSFFADALLRKQILKEFKRFSLKKPEQLTAKAATVRQLILKHTFDPVISKQLESYFVEIEERLLRTRGKGIRLVVSGAGREHAFTAKTVNDVAKGVRQLYALAFSEQELFERLKNNWAVLPDAYAVVVQYQEKPEFSGVAYAHDSSVPDDKTITIAAHHLGSLHPDVATDDIYRIDRKTLLLLSRDIRKQWWANDGGKHVSPAHLGKPLATLTDAQAVQLARLVKIAQAKFETTKQFGWVWVHKQFWLTSVTDYAVSPVEESLLSEGEGPTPLIHGQSGVLGCAVGPVRRVHTKADQKKVRAGDVVVLERLHAEDAAWLSTAAALIVETGHHGGLEGEITRLLAAPTILATGKALAVLTDGQLVTVDATHGVVYPGDYRQITHLPPSQARQQPVTGTKLYASAHDPRYLQPDTLQLSDGIGLLRSEFILRLVGVHPQEIIQRKLHDEYVDILADGLVQAAQAVYPRPVIYQLQDLSPADFNGFRARQHDRHEPNPLIGYRGMQRLLAEPEVLDLELAALGRAMRRTATNFSLLLPMTRNVEEVRQALAYLRGSEQSLGAGLERLPIWIKCETPALAMTLGELPVEDIAGVLFEVSALSQLLLGIDQANYQVGHQLDQSELAVLQTVQQGVTDCRSLGLASAVVAEAELLRPELIEVAVEAGVTAVTVLPEYLEDTRRLLASIERQLVIDHLLSEG